MAWLYIYERALSNKPEDRPATRVVDRLTDRYLLGWRPRDSQRYECWRKSLCLTEGTRSKAAGL